MSTAAIDMESGVSRIPRGLWLWFGLVVVAKLILTSNEEIAAFNLPHDDLWHIRAALRGYWGGAYAPVNFFHLPIYSFFIGFVRLFGIPLRVASELVYCGAAVYLAVAVWRIGVPAVISGAVGAAVILHPASFQLPNRCSAETILAPLLMAAIAASLSWWAVRKRTSNWGPAVLAAVWWALAWNTRKESIVLVPVLFAFALCIWFADWHDGRRPLAGRLAIGVLLPLCAAIALSATFKTVNYFRWGLYANSVLTAPGYTAAFKSLQRIRPEKPLDFISVPVEVRHRAYSVSPAFAELKPFLEGPVGEGWAVHSRRWTSGKGIRDLDPLEVAAGWFYWCLYDAVVAAGHGASPAEADRFLARIAREINTAIADGRVPGRWVPVAMVDPEFARWLPRVPRSIGLIARLFTPTHTNRGYGKDPKGEIACGWEFDQGATRRAWLIPKREGQIDGWVVASKGRVKSLELRAADGSIIAAVVPNLPRPDVNPANPSGFRLRFITGSPLVWKSARLAAVIDDGKIVEWPVTAIIEGNVVFQRIADECVVTLACDLARVPSFTFPMWQAVKAWRKGYSIIFNWLRWPALAGACVLLVALIRRRRPVIVPAIVLLAMMIAVRILFFAIIDASAWDVSYIPRYLYPVMPLDAALTVLAVWILVQEGCMSLPWFRKDRV